MYWNTPEINKVGNAFNLTDTWDVLKSFYQRGDLMGGSTFNRHMRCIEIICIKSDIQPKEDLTDTWDVLK